MNFYVEHCVLSRIITIRILSHDFLFLLHSQPRRLSKCLISLLVTIKKFSFFLLNRSLAFHLIMCLIRNSHDEDKVNRIERKTTNVCEKFYRKLNCIINDNVETRIFIQYCCHHHLKPRASLLFTTSFLPLLNFTISHHTH